MGSSRQQKTNGKIMVAMSGGVDSSVSALLLKQQGCDLSGMFMKNWEEDDRFGTCAAEEDAADAAAVAGLLEIPFHTRNFAAEYWDNVFEDFLSEYRAGRTPNPDVLCNREIKFKTFLEHAAALGAEHIATGHFVRTESRDGRFRLLRGSDKHKDQSYFLYAIGHRQLAQTLFPVGGIEKPAVREIALSSKLRVHDKKDSTGICFIGERNFREFLGAYIPAQPGLMKTPDGQVLGEHDGLMFHTLGQRQGLGIGGIRGFADKPWYVLHKDLEENTLYVGQGHDHPWLHSSELSAGSLSWVTGQAPTAGDCLTAKVRYRQSDQDCEVIRISRDHMRIRFGKPQRAVTPGQSVVLYSGDECLGGGIINSMNADPFNEEASA
jgi:tRNA-specific 2-thiouridylase